MRGILICFIVLSALHLAGQNLTYGIRTGIGVHGSWWRYNRGIGQGWDRTDFRPLAQLSGEGFIRYKNIEAVGVEDFTFDYREPKKYMEEGWPNMRSHMYDTLQKYQFVDDVNSENIKIIESNFADVSWSSQQKFDVIFFDLEPVTADIYDTFFKKVFNAFSRQCVVIFSMYSHEEVAPVLEQKVEQYSDRLVTEFKHQRISSGSADAFGYYSGVAIYGFRKKAFAKND